jgi:fatty acid desaturase
MSAAFAIPGTLNLALLAGAIGAACLCLYLASHGDLIVMIAAAFAFSFINNMIFSLMHEAVHRIFHRRASINELAGRIAAIFFPTSFSLQRLFHLEHHRNNRSDVERFDYYQKGDNRVVKFVQWYCILTGLYWLAAPIFCIVYCLTAELIGWTRLFGEDSRFARQTSAGAFLESLRSASPAIVRLEVASCLIVHGALIVGLGLTWSGWLLCYACFAVNWSSLQYADHAFSPLDRNEGAWNLKVSPITRFMFLNYHYHLVHHRHPQMPWTKLPALAKDGDPSPSFWSVYWKMWAGPRPLPSNLGQHVPSASDQAAV